MAQLAVIYDDVECCSDQTVTIISKMLNHTRISTVTSAIIALLFVQFLFIDYVTGFRGEKMHDAFSRKIARGLRITSGTNDIIYTKNDVTGKQEVTTSSSSSSASCPADCECVHHSYSVLEINCEMRFTNATSLSREINSYLTGVSWNGRKLSIVDTPLTVVPESVCQLKQLTWLKLYGNRFLTRLPDNCFTRLPRLQFFGAVDCGLTSLQNGLFDNLTELQTVSFTNNFISSIGTQLFDVAANLPNLHTIDLSLNNLTEIDTWPVKRAQLINGSVIDLSDNLISTFTNSLGWHYDCNSAPLLTPTIDLKLNKIRHLNDLFHGWNITGLFCSVFMPVARGASSDLKKSHLIPTTGL